MLHGFDFSKLVFLSILDFTHFKCQLSSHSSIPDTYTLDVQQTPNQIDSDVTYSRLRDQGKITKMD